MSGAPIRRRRSDGQGGSTGRQVCCALEDRRGGPICLWRTTIGLLSSASPGRAPPIATFILASEAYLSQAHIVGTGDGAAGTGDEDAVPQARLS
jgi:hypothetical protein